AMVRASWERCGASRAGAKRIFACANAFTGTRTATGPRSEGFTVTESRVTPMATKVAVIGAGSWGTAVACLSVRNAPTVLWARSPEVADEIARVHTNSRYLSGVTLPSGLGATSKLADALHGADVVVMAV